MTTYGHDDYLNTLQAFTQTVETNHPDSETARFLSERLRELQTVEGTAFPARWQYLINQLPVVKSSEQLKWTPEEREYWSQIKDMNQLGNWGWTLNV